MTQSLIFTDSNGRELRLPKGKIGKEAWRVRPGSGRKPRAALPGVLLEVRELAEGFLTEVTTVGLSP